MWAGTFFVCGEPFCVQAYRLPVYFGLFFWLPFFVLIKIFICLSKKDYHSNTLIPCSVMQPDPFYI